MEYTVPCPAPAMPPETTISPSDPLVVSSEALLAAFANVPDPRRRQGTRFPLPAILALAVAAILSNHLSVLAIAEWGASQCRDLLLALGFVGDTTPHQSTLQRLFRKLEPDHLSTALTNYFCASTATEERARGSQGVAIDGKAQRGRLAFDSSRRLAEARGCPVHALSAFLHEQGVVLAQEPIEAEGQSEKAEAELTVAPGLIARIDWQGRVMTGDALFCQRTICQQITEAGGDYLFVVKENQPTLYEDIHLFFDPPADLALPLDDRREVRTIDNGHGRHHDTRHLIASTDLVGYGRVDLDHGCAVSYQIGRNHTDWPGLAQVFRLERTWQERGAIKREVQYGITSLPPEIADASRLLALPPIAPRTGEGLALKRGHWQIENGLHCVKDVTLGEDRSPIHLGNGPSVMAMLRYHSCHPDQAVALLTGNCCQNA
ncbi:MAG: ISAs1 family transposase [Chloroflexi bacterium]|nr:ISAs1 family transposase [Chloroflexota bacterium]